MKLFILSLLAGVGLATAAVVAVGQSMFPELSREEGEVNQGFSQRDAVEVIAARLGSGASADRARQRLRREARFEYHSPGHWRVRLGDASWVAHGTGQRYAEPENEAAKALEAAQ